MADLELHDPEVADYENSSFDRENNITPGMFDGPPQDDAGGGIPDSIKFALDNPESMNLASGDERAATRPGANITDDPEYKRLTAEGERLQGEKHKLTDKMLEQMEADRREMGTLQPPQLQESPKAPPAQRMAQGAMEWMQIATLLGALAGGLGRRNSTAALNAFGSAIKGFMTGNQQAYQAGVDEWKENSQKVIQDNQAKLDQYNLILKNKKMDMDQKMSMLKIAAAQYDDEITYNLAERKDYTNFSLANAKENQLMQYYADRHNLMLAQTDRVKEQIGIGEAGGQEAIQGMVERRLTGDKSAATGMGRSIAAMQAFQKALAATMKARGITAADLTKIDQQYVGDTAQQRLRGSMSQRVEAATNEVEKAIPVALQASQALPRGKFVPINRLKQLGQKATSDPQWNAFLVANQTLAKAYGRAMNPQGVPRVSEAMEAAAHGFLDMAASPQAYMAQVRMLWTEVQNSKRAVAESREGIGPDLPFPGGDAGSSTNLAPGEYNYVPGKGAVPVQ